MITLQYFNGDKWVDVDKFVNEYIAWISLGNDTLNYRTVDENDKVLTDKSPSGINEKGMGWKRKEW